MEILTNINNYITICYSNGNGYGKGYGNGEGNGYGYGKGYGNGNGDGYGNGEGNGEGNGNGYGYGKGYGYGYGNGNGDGDGNGKAIIMITIKNIKYYVKLIDNISTIIINIKNNIARGFILNDDFSLTPCYIIKQNNLFAHGKTLKEANESLNNKLFSTYTIKERISKFNETFKNYSIQYSAKLLFEWHGNLTNSCSLGRESFCKNNNINLTKDKYTIYEFIELTKNEYNGDIIKQLKQ